jgi:hypothetical protein
VPGFRSPLVRVLMLLMVATACGPAPGPSGSATPTRSDAPAPSGSASGETSPGTSGSAPAADAAWLPEWAEADVPAEVANRPPLRFCGVERAPAPTPMEYIDPVVRACFWDVWQAGGQAEFASVQSTMEGDPIATIYRLTPDGSIEVLVDGSRDRFGSGGWTLTRCASLMEDAEGQAFFGTADCDEATPVE